MTALVVVDEHLRLWDERLLRVDENLLALESDATYQMLAGTRGTAAALVGITRDRVVPALDAMQRLFEQREKIVAVLDHAKEIRASISPYSLWGTEEKIAEIDALFLGPSVTMGQASTPLAHRHLLDVAARDVAVRPEELLGAMVSAFEVARDAVFAVGNAWSKLEPALAELDEELAVLKRHAERAGASIPAELLEEARRIERELEVLKGAVVTDPLGAEGTLDATLRPRLLAARKAIDAAAGARAHVDAALVSAKAARAELDAAREAAREAIATVNRELGPFVAAPRAHAVDDAALAELDAWYAKLEATAAAGRYERAEIGIARFVEAANGHRDAERAVVLAKDALMARRIELVGRLSARRAQLRALHARGLAVSAELEQHGRDAEASLTRRPCPLDEAAALVEAFERAVVGLSRS